MNSNEVFRRTDYITVVGEVLFRRREAAYEQEHGYKPCGERNFDKTAGRELAFGAYRTIAVGAAIVAPILGLAKILSS